MTWNRVPGVTLREYLAEAVARDFADAELTRREALKRLGLLGLSTTAAGALLAAWSRDNRESAKTARERTAAPVLASATAPAPPADIVNGRGAWRIIEWGGSDALFVDAEFWHKRGWGGYAVGFGSFRGYGGVTNFRGTTAVGTKGRAFQVQRWIEGVGLDRGGMSFPDRCHQHGCEAYIGGYYYVSQRVANGLSAFDWWSDAAHAELASKFSGLAAMCQLTGMDGLKADTETADSAWALDYVGNTHTDQQNRDRVRTWGFEVGKAVHQAFPSCKILVYHWSTVEGYWDRFFYHDGATNLITAFWLGWIEAMATYGSNESRFINTDAGFYKPSMQSPGAQLEAAAKLTTQGGIAWLSRNVAPTAWDKVCDRIDITHFIWAGTDNRDNPAKFYHHTGEPAFANQHAVYRRLSMGSRRANYTQSSDASQTGRGPGPGGYCWINHTTPDPTCNLKNNWYIVNPSNPPGGHGPGILAGASRAFVSTTPPTITQTGKVNNGNGTFTLTGVAYHLDGIRCVRGYVHPHTTARVGAQMTFNPRGGTRTTDYNVATQDFTITVNGTPGEYLMLTAVSIHDQEHSIRVQL